MNKSHVFAQGEMLFEGYLRELQEIRESPGADKLDFTELETKLEFHLDLYKHFRYYTSLTEERDDFDAGLQLCYFSLNLIKRIDATLPQTQADFDIDCGSSVDGLPGTISEFREKLGREATVLKTLLNKRTASILRQLRRFHNSQPVTFQGRSAPCYAELVESELCVREVLSMLSGINDSINIIEPLREDSTIIHNLKIEFEEAKYIDVSTDLMKPPSGANLENIDKQLFDEIRELFNEIRLQIDSNKLNSESQMEAIRNLKPRYRKAYKTYLYACLSLEKNAVDREAYEFLKDQGVPKESGDPDFDNYKITSFETWTSYLTKARKQLGLGKYGKKTDRISSRSVVRNEQIDRNLTGSDDL